MADTPRNVTPFPADHISSIAFPAEEIEDNTPAQDHDVFPPMVVLPYQDPLQRALGTMGKQATIAFVTAVLLGLGDLVAKVTVGDLIDQRAITLAILALVIHAGLVAVQKYTSAKAGDEASQ